MNDPTRSEAASAALWVGAVTALGAALRLYAVGEQPATADEMMCLPTALGFLKSGLSIPSMPFHPPLRNLVLAASASLFGPGVLGLRGPSLLMGIATVPLLGALVFRLSGRAAASGIAAFLLAVDPVSIYFSRQTFQEVWTAAFALGAVLCVVDALAAGDARRWRWELPLAGLLFGAGIAAKFYVVPAWAACCALVAWVTFRQKRGPEAVFAFAALVPIAALVFLATWSPWFARGNSAGEWFQHQASLFDAMASHQKELVNHWRFHQPSRWFLQPFLGWTEVLYGPNDKPLAMAVSHPLTWLAVLPAAIFLAVKHRFRTPEATLLWLFCACWAPLLIASRPVWLISAQVVLPFGLALVALAAADLLEQKKARAFVLGWLALVAAVALALFPASIGRARDVGYLAPLVAHVGDYGSASWELP